MAGYSHTRNVLPRRNCGNDRKGIFFIYKIGRIRYGIFMIRKYNRDLDVIKTIDEEYKDDDKWEGRRAYSLDVLNMNLWSLQVPVSIQLRWSSNSGSVIKKGFNFLCPEDLFVGAFKPLSSPRYPSLCLTTFYPSSPLPS